MWQGVYSYTGWWAHSLIAAFLWMEGSKVQGTFQFCGYQSGLSGKLSEFCSPVILEGFITLKLIWSPISYYTYASNSYPLVLSARVLHNFADMACEFHPKNVPLLHGPGHVQEVGCCKPTETCLTFSQTFGWNSIACWKQTTNPSLVRHSRHISICL